RQRRADGRCQHRSGAHGPHLRAGTLRLRRPAAGQHARRRDSLRRGADRADPARAAAAERDDRPLHSHPALLRVSPLTFGRHRGKPRAAVGWLAALLLLAAVPQPVVAQQDASAARAELKQTEAEIKRLKRMLDGLRQEMSGVERQLRDSESEIGRLRREAADIEREIGEGEARLQSLEQQAAALQNALEAQQEQIARQVRSAYMAGRQDYLKMLLNQDDPSRMARMMRYYGDFNQARVEE